MSNLIVFFEARHANFVEDTTIHRRKHSRENMRKKEKK